MSVYVCPACGERFTPDQGSIVPRPCPRCLERAGRVVELMPSSPKPPDPPRSAKR